MGPSVFMNVGPMANLQKANVSSPKYPNLSHLAAHHSIQAHRTCQKR
jgi:hypothetical protein